MFCLIWLTSQIGSRCDGTSGSPVLSPHPHVIESGLSLFVIIVPIKRQFWSILMWEKPTYALCCLLCIPLCISDCIPIMVYYGIFHSCLYYIYIIYVYIFTGYFFWLNHLFCWLNHFYTVCFPPRNGWSIPETTPRATVNLTQSGRDEGSATTTLRPGSLSHWIPSSPNV